MVYKYYQSWKASLPPSHLPLSSLVERRDGYDLGWQVDGVARLPPAGHQALPLPAQPQLQAHGLAHVQHLLQELRGVRGRG